MKRRLLSLFGILSVLILSNTDTAYAQITISGDARVRPRWDINDRTGNNQNLTRDVYVMYRARVNMTADIGDGWSFNSLFGHNGVGEYAGKFSRGELPDILGVEQSNISNDAARRATVDFMLLNIAYKHHLGGFKLGLFALGAVSNPVYDLHYYPARMVDIPYFIFNNDGIYGFSGYRNFNEGNTKLEAALYVDDDRGEFIKNSDGEVLQNNDDQYTLELGLNHKTAGINWRLQSLYTLAADSIAKPITISLQSSGWQLGKTRVDGQVMYSNQRTDNPVSNQGHFGLPMNSYDAWFFRITTIRKFGSDRLRVWWDLSNRIDHLETGDMARQFHHIWAEYAIQLAKTDHGRIVLIPRIRQQLVQDDGVQRQLRHKIEMDLDIFF